MPRHRESLGIIFIISLAATACNQEPSIKTENESFLADESFGLDCSGWIDGTTKIGGHEQALETQTYKTKMRWDGTRKALTTTDSEGPLDFCVNGLAEKCDVRIEDGHLIAQSTMSGPGSKPEIIVRTIGYLHVDLATGKAVEKTKILSGQIVSESRANWTMEIDQVAQLNCSRVSG